MKRLVPLMIPALVCAALPALAQRDLATVVGTVSDPTGGVIAGARVTITEDATGLVYRVLTDNAGNYIRTALKPGVYTVQCGGDWVQDRHPAQRPANRWRPCAGRFGVRSG